MAHGPLHSLVGRLRAATDDLPDAELLARYRDTRDESAFAALVRRHGPLVMAACRPLLADAADIDDAFQATFLMLVREVESIREGTALGGWLYRVAYRIALRVRQKGERRRELGEPRTIEPDLSWREACTVLHEELDRMPEKFRLPLVLCYLDGQSRDEAGRQLGWTEGMVKGRLERGRNMLRERLTRRGVTLSAGLLGAMSASRADAVAPRLVNSLLQIVLNPPAAPAKLLELCKGVSTAMIQPRRWPLVAALFLAGLLGTGALLLARPGLTEEPPAKIEKNESTVLTGLVVSKGMPIEGARVYWPKISADARDESDIKMPVRATSAKDGEFRFELSAEDVRKDLPIPLVVAADGYAVGWVARPQFGGHQTLTLVKERVITGRLLDTQGKPLVGVSILLEGILAPENFEQFLTAWKRDWSDATRSVGNPLRFPLMQIIPPVKSDAEGRFAVKGVADGQIAILQLTGAGVTKQTIHAVNRGGFDGAAINRALQQQNPQDATLPGRLPMLVGTGFEHVASASKVIQGIVTDGRSGKPIAGARVSSNVGYAQSSRSLTDAKGRYQLTGIPKQKDHSVSVQPPKDGTTLLSCTTRVLDTEGLTPITADISLNHGVILTGRIIDEKTGKGVYGVVRFAPLPDNAYFGKRLGYDSYRYERMGGETKADGRFQIAVITGSGVLMCQANHEGFIDGVPIKPWRQAEFTAEERKRVEVNERDRSYRYFATAGGSTEGLNIHQAVRVLDLKEGQSNASVELVLKRGLTKKVRVVDAEGKPLPGFTVSGMTDAYPTTYRIKNDSCEILALDPAAPRLVVFLHPERKLAGMVTLRGDEKEAVSVKLGPAASLKGRLLDLDGNPLVGADMSASYLDEVVRELYRHLKPPPPAIRTDADGRFEITGLVPSMPMSLGIRKDKSYFVGEPRLGEFKLETGKALDLGDRKVKPGQ